MTSTADRPWLDRGPAAMIPSHLLQDGFPAYSTIELARRLLLLGSNRNGTAVPWATGGR